MKFFSCISLLGLPLLAWGQSDFTFKATCYLTDAAGHADTVWLFGDTIMVNDSPDTTVWRGIGAEQADPERPFQTFLLPWYDVLYGATDFQEALLHGFEPARYYRSLVAHAPGGVLAEPVFWLFKTSYFPVAIRFENDQGDGLQTTVWLPDHGTLSQPDAIPGLDYPLDQYCCLNAQSFCSLNPIEPGNIPGAEIFGFIPGASGPLQGILLTPRLNLVCGEVGTSAAAKPSVRVFPNPATDLWCVEMPTELLPATLRLNNGLGQTVFQQVVSANRTCLNYAGLPGVYTLVIDSQYITQSARLVVTR